MDYIVENQEEETKGAYTIHVDGKKVGEMTYSIAGTDRIIIDHTEVTDEFRGSGAGEEMVRKAVADARTKGISIVPLCPFARAVFSKNEELKDVL